MFKETLKRVLKKPLYYTPFWHTDIAGYIRQKYFWKSVKKLPLESFRIALDAGCGPGFYAIKLAKKYPGMNVIGCDIKNEIAQDVCPENFKFIEKDLLFLDETDIYDFVYSIDVLEHIPNNRQIIKNIYNALKPGGFFYLAMPNDEINGERIFPERFFEDLQSWTNGEHIGEQYTLPEIVSIFKSSGFNIIKSEWTFSFLGKLAWEAEWVTRDKFWILIPIMPFLRVLGTMDTYLPKSRGHILIIGQKPKQS